MHSGIDLVITDINMPVMDGLTLLRRAGELQRILKTVIISAYDDMENIRAAMNGGAYDFLTKPIDFCDLEKTIAKSQRELLILRQGEEAREDLATLEHELRIATALQQAILPEVIVGREEFEIAASMAAARRVSGDFYDFFLLDATRLGLAIAVPDGSACHPPENGAPEGPIHAEEIVVRVRQLWGLARTGNRIQSAVTNAIEAAVAHGRIRRSDHFCSIPDGKVVVRDRTAVRSATLRKTGMLPLAEV